MPNAEVTAAALAFKVDTGCSICHAKRRAGLRGILCKLNRDDILFALGNWLDTACHAVAGRQLFDQRICDTLSPVSCML